MTVDRRADRPTVSSNLGQRRFDLRGAGVRRQPQFGGVPQRLTDGERFVQHVLLRHDGDVLLERLEVGVQVRAVEQHRPRVGRGTAAEDRQQRRFAGAAGSEQADELARPNDQGDVVEQRQRRRRFLDRERHGGHLGRSVRRCRSAAGSETSFP